jgi:hypothetical protein
MLIKGFIPKSFFTFRRGDLKFVGFHILIKTPNIYSIGLKDNTVSRTFFINLLDGVLPSLTNRTRHGRYLASYRGF